jgi:hypothetical protein
MDGINFEDAQALLQQLQRFQETIGNDWGSVRSKWGNLQNSWQDSQYDKFEPFFDELCRTYSECERQQEEYTQYLTNLLSDAEETTQVMNV